MLHDDVLPGPERLAGLAAEFEGDTGVLHGVAVTGDTVQDLGTDGRLTGYGLTGMRERAELLGGTLTAGPTGGGFLVEFWVAA
jgi:hypothetical protein